MARSPTDVLTVEPVDGGGVFDRFTTFKIRNSIVAPAEASFEVGDAATFNSLRTQTRLGAQFRVTVNGRPRLSGRVEQRNSPADAARSSVVRFTVRTKLADAWVSSADPRISLTARQPSGGAISLKDFVIACYDTVGVSADQIVFRADVARDLLTGRPTRGGRVPLDVEPIQQDQAKIRPPETVQQAVDRHLRRFGLMQCDTPDGKIAVFAPDDTQDPTYRFRLLAGAQGAWNNALSVETNEDVGQAATVLGVYGMGGGRSFVQTRISAVEGNATLADGGFLRPVLIVDEGIRTKDAAQRRARREMAGRSRSLSGLTVVVDALSHDDGDGGRVQYAPDTVADVVSEINAVAYGAYYVETVELERTTAGDRGTLAMVPRGVWVL